jgi:membrane-bound lytic murein transglycosylase F
VGILQNTTDYYLENGDIKGFHYDLIELFVKQAGLKNTHYVVYDTYWDHLIALLTNEVDVLAMDINSAFYQDVFFLYTVAHSYSQHVLVQRKDDIRIAENTDYSTDSENRTTKTILCSVPAFSGFYRDALLLMRKHKLSGITVSAIESWNSTDFLDKLNKKEVDMVITNKKIMQLHSLWYNTLDYDVTLTDTFPLHWAVHKENTSLQRPINTWLDSFKRTNSYLVLWNKYYAPNSQNRQKIKRQQRNNAHGAISEYDALLKQYAHINNLDWRLVAAVIYQESHFNPNSIGKGGAHGLMQIMPNTAASLNIDSLHLVENQIASGCKLLHKLANLYRAAGVDSADLYKFVLAAYNAGNCHVDDARLLAKINGLNPDKWDEVSKMLVKLSDRNYIKNKPLACGVCNGRHTKTYVLNVWMMYRHYRNMTDL